MSIGSNGIFIGYDWSIMNNVNTIAIWVITPDGFQLASRIVDKISGCELLISSGSIHEKKCDISFRYSVFENLKEKIATEFIKHSGHIFVMSSGIVVRMIAPHIQSKLTDPAVLVIDDQGKHVISLVSGHVGGANALAEKVAGFIGADPVITTATDVNNVPAIDMIAVENGLSIENHSVIKCINMAFLTKKEIGLYDPYEFLKQEDETCLFTKINTISEHFNTPVVIIDDKKFKIPANTLVLRPKSLVVGMGCNRNTSKNELMGFLKQILDDSCLSINSIMCLATVDLKKDEKGLTGLAEELNVPVKYFSTDALNSVKTIKNPSQMVEKHIGVKSVCEAAAILAANNKKLIVQKQTRANVTAAIVRTDSI